MGVIKAYTTIMSAYRGEVPCTVTSAKVYTPPCTCTCTYMIVLLLITSVYTYNASELSYMYMYTARAFRMKVQCTVQPCLLVLLHELVSFECQHQ